jgi:hypothetical protein
MKVIVAYGVRFQSGMEMCKQAVCDVETGELESWDNIPVHAVRGDTPEKEIIYFATPDPYFMIEREILTVGNKKRLATPLTAEEKKQIKSL